MNILEVPPSKIPPRADYQWSSLAVAGDVSMGDLDRMKEGGWRPVPKSRHMDLPCAQRSTSAENIVVGSLVLVERPKIMTEQSQDAELFKAQMQRNLMQRATSEDDAIAFKLHTAQVTTKTALRSWKDWGRYQLRRPVVWLRLKWIRLMDGFR